MQELARKNDQEAEDDLPVVKIGIGYDGVALDRFTRKMSIELPKQFSIWPRVYQTGPTKIGIQQIKNNK